MDGSRTGVTYRDLFWVQFFDRAAIEKLKKGSFQLMGQSSYCVLCCSCEEQGRPLEKPGTNIADAVCSPFKSGRV